MIGIATIIYQAATSACTCEVIYKYKEKNLILQSLGIIVTKSKETTVLTYTCRYSSGHLIPIIQYELGIKCLLECFLAFYINYYSY